MDGMGTIANAAVIITEFNVRVMIFANGDIGHSVYKGNGAGKVFEIKGAGYHGMVWVKLPARDLFE
jgi:hypothetical protein